MGSFDVSCGLSNIAIESGDRTGFLFLNDIRREYDYTDALPHGESLVIYHNDLYRPFFAPIYGSYSDYGSLEDIEENVTTKVLEAILGLSIDTIMEIVTSSNHGVYNTSSPLPEAFGLDPKTFDYKKTDYEVLTALGFTTVKEGSEYDYNGNRFTIGDHRWSAVRTDGRSKELKAHDIKGALEHFGDLIGSYPGYDKALTGRLDTIRRLSGMFFSAEVFEAVKKVPESEWEADNTSRWQEKWDEYIATFTRTEDEGTQDGYTLMMARQSEYVSRNMSVPPEYRDHFAAYAGTDEILDLYRLEIAFSKTNHLFAPTLYAGQEGNDEHYRAMSAAAIVVLDERRKKYDEDNI